MATSYDITNLDAKLKNYLSANKDELISKAVFNSKSSRLLNLQTGVKNPTAIVRLDSSVTLADGTTCGFNATGEDVFTNRTLTPAFIKVNKQFCPKDFLNTWKASDVKMAATGQDDNMPFEQQIIEANLNQLGVVFALSTVLGGLTPPVGIYLFLAMNLTGAKMKQVVFPHMLIVIGIMLAVIVLCILLPIPQFLPNLVFGPM